MTYLAHESSTQGGHPVELYRFALGDHARTLTSAQREIVHAGETYRPAAIRRSAIELTPELHRATVEIALARDAGALFVPGAPEGVVSVTIFRRHLTDPDAETIVLWKGRVVGARFSGSEVTLRCESVATSLRRPGLRAHYEISCRHALYSAGCGLAREDWRIAGTVTAVSGATAQVPQAATRPDGWFNAGYLEAAAGMRMITAHSAQTIVLSAPLVGLAAGDAVRLYAGCDHAFATCDAKFSNRANYGGFPWIPRKNPFSGDAIV